MTGYAVDTSVAIAALDESHAAHSGAAKAVRRYRPQLAGHAAFETFSLLSRMPGSRAVHPVDAIAAIDVSFPRRVWLPSEEQAALYGRLGSLGITGGAVYDALVAHTAVVSSLKLLTRDLRARRTYDLLGVAYSIVDD